MKLTEEEKAVWWNYRDTRAYPRWQKTACGFLLYRHPDAWVEAVSHTRDGAWITGTQYEGAEKKFTRLEQAFTYAEMLHYRSEYLARESQLNPEGSGLVVNAV